MLKNAFLICCLLFSVTFVAAQDPTNISGTIYSEELVPPYTPPRDILTTFAGQKIKTTKEWETIRRPEIIKVLSTEMYGFTPQEKIPVSYRLVEINKNAFNGKATRKQIEMTFSNNGKSLKVQLLLYSPNNKKKPAPVFEILNFCGNQSLDYDSAIVISKTLTQEFGKTVYKNRIARTERGADAYLYPLEEMIDHGIGFATAWYGDFDPDYYDGFHNGIHNLFLKDGEKHGDKDWGSIGAWAWGLSRIMDYIETDKDFDAKKVAVIGHSRNAKAALWASAQDQRFAITIPNNSGCGGAALMKRIYGETASSINKLFPHWFCENFKKYNNNEDSLTTDSHELVALVAPRPLYVGSAKYDQWADPKGEFIGMYKTQPIWELYGKKRFAYDQMTPLGFKVIKSQIGYHYREGKHDLLICDWEAYIVFLEYHFNM